MNIPAKRQTPLASVLACAGLLFVAGQAAAAEYWLCAKSGSVTMPGGAVVPIWGYVQDDNANLGDGCPALDSTTWTAAGPALNVPSADLTGLTVHLRNDLTEPTSLVIPGQTAAMTPVWTDGTSGPRTATTQRVRSFTHEAGTGGGTADYTWADIRPGSYLYHSGTHPQVQVQMGLYGAVTRNFSDLIPGVPAVPPDPNIPGDPGTPAVPAVPSQAYSGVPYGAALTLLLSEIDPAQHAAIAAGTYGAAGAPVTPCPDSGGTALPMTSTLCYRPKYFLINGKPFQMGDPAMTTLSVGQDTLLRLLNAGLRSYAPTVQGTYMKMVAEDGNRYQYREAGLDFPRDQYQYSTLLASLKTTDAVITPASLNGIVIYDRRLHLVNNLAQDGGMFVKFDAVCLAGSCADLTIAKTDGLTSVNRGTPVTYTITVGNAGPAAVTGAQVADILSADFTGATWTCSASAGAACGAAAGSGNIATTVDLPVGGTATFTVSGTVSAAATGSLVNTATVALPAGVSDPNPADNSATDSDALILLADLSITKTDGVTDVVAGGPVSYTIVAGNAGPDPAIGAMVTDTLPATLSGVAWTCAAAGGATCAASGSGNLATAVDLPMGGTAAFTINATLGAAATGSLVNTATVAGPANVIDANAANNSATDTDTITPPPVTTQAYFSTAGNTVVPGVAGANDDADIYAWNSDGSYARVFDASVAGVPAEADVDAFVYNGPGDVYLSFNNNLPVNLPGVAGVQDEDIVHWNGTTWSLHFDGSAVGLGDSDAEDVDAFAFPGDGSVLVSTFGNPAVAGLTGLADEDLLRCAGTFGPATSCVWNLYFDGSDIGLTTTGEDIDFASVAAGGDIRLSTRGTFAVASGASSLAGSGNQVFACTGPTTGAASACAGFSSLLTLPILPTGSMDAISQP
ncbi:MAG: hypothetical protein ROZ09_15380 [Thiobacillus sp.]|uniref:hypothetical protein n=1 Tax=Thiobacillus sp. TaxID=924 RepID=UPI0028953421|nr:hypothetical protein [Thiobacillus sp.]MDT3708199.1 hypothetical protein [Thiobacillus sp.]